MKIEGLYIDYLKKLKKEEITNLIDKFHVLCHIYNYPVAVEDIKSKKEDLINYLVDKASFYVKFLVQSLNNKDYKELNKITKKKMVNEDLLKYFQASFIIFNDNVMAKDTYDLLKKALKSKRVFKEVKKSNEIYEISNGIIVAYGTLKISDFTQMLGEENLELANNYYQKNYRVENDKVIALALNNKKKINKYLKNKKMKSFSLKQFQKLGNNTYHHSIKIYHRLVKTLKNNYIFQNRDIMFLDTNIIIPYLYNNLAMEQEAQENLNKNIDFYFEYANQKLKTKIINEVVELKKEFPIWEKRGFSIAEDESVNE